MTMRIALVVLLAASCGGSAQQPPVSADPQADAAPPTAAPSAVATLAMASASPSPTPTASPTATPTAAPRELVFADARSGVRLSIHADPTDRYLGTFVVQVPDRGAYEARAGSGMVASATDITLRYEGPAVLHPLVSALDLTTTRGIVKVPTEVKVRVIAQLDPLTRTGTATLEHDGFIVTMIARVPDVSDLPRVFDAFERATLAGDGLLLYSVMNTDITTASTADAFARQLAAQIAQVGSTTSIRRGAVSAPAPSDFGFWTVTVLYDTEVRAPNGVSTGHRYEAFFIRQTAGWKLWFTREL